MKLKFEKFSKIHSKMTSTIGAAGKPSSVGKTLKFFKLLALNDLRKTEICRRVDDFHGK